MSVNQQATLNALNGRYLDTDTGRINETCLNEALCLALANDARLYRGMHSKPHRKATAIAWEALAYLANEALKDEAYPNKPTTCSSEHLKKWLKEYGRGYETLAETVAWVASEQETK